MECVWSKNLYCVRLIIGDYKVNQASQQAKDGKIHDRMDSLFNSVTSAAKASGLAPSSNNWAQMFKVSRSRPVASKFDISKTTKRV